MQTKLPAPEILRSEGIEPENLLAFLEHALCVVLNLRVEVLSCRRCRLSARRLNGPCRRTHQHHDHADAEYVSSASCHLRSSSMKPARTAYRVVNSLAASVLRRLSQCVAASFAPSGLSSRQFTSDSESRPVCDRE